MLKLVKWLIKLYVKRHPEYVGTGGIYIDEQTEVDIVVSRYYDDYYQHGTLKQLYKTPKEKEISDDLE